MQFEIYKLALESSFTVRQFDLPNINFNAKFLIKLLDPSSLWFPPPILTKLTLDEIEQGVENGNLQNIFYHIPCRYTSR